MVPPVSHPRGGAVHHAEALARALRRSEETVPKSQIRFERSGVVSIVGDWPFPPLVEQKRLKLAKETPTPQKIHVCFCNPLFFVPPLYLSTLSQSRRNRTAPRWTALYFLTSYAATILIVLTACMDSVYQTQCHLLAEVQGVSSYASFVSGHCHEGPDITILKLSVTWAVPHSQSNHHQTQGKRAREERRVSR